MISLNEKEKALYERIASRVGNDHTVSFHVKDGKLKKIEVSFPDPGGDVGTIDITDHEGRA